MARLFGTILLALIYRRSDELMLAGNLEAGSLSYGLAFVVIGTWALLADFGYATGPEPLDLLSLFYMLVLTASFVAVGRRAMLKIE